MLVTTEHRNRFTLERVEVGLEVVYLRPLAVRDSARSIMVLSLCSKGRSEKDSVLVSSLVCRLTISSLTG